MRVDAILITTVEADSIEEAERFIRSFADGLADDHGAPFTGLVKLTEDPILKRRVAYLHSLDGPSPCGGAEDGWHLTPEAL